MDISKSLASLVKYNEGFFKSEKQSSFIRSILDEGKYFTTSFTFHRNTMLMHYVCDEKGVTKVTKESFKTGKTEVTFERGIMTDGEKRRIRKLEKEIKVHKEGIRDRNEIKSRNEPGCVYRDEKFYRSVIDSTLLKIKNCEEAIQSIKSKYDKDK